MSIKDKISSFWDYIALNYNTTDFSDNNSIVWKNEFEQKFADNDSLNIIEIGTGNGFISLVLAELGHKVTAIDISSNMLSIAKAEAKYRNLDIDFILMDADKIQFPASYFDVVIMRNTTWTLDRPEIVYKEIYRVLKPKGIFLNYESDIHNNSIFNISKDSLLNESTLMELNDKWNQLKNDLVINYVKRPQWDISILKNIGFIHCKLDKIKDTNIIAIYALKPCRNIVNETEYLFTQAINYSNLYYEQIGISSNIYNILYFVFTHPGGLRPSDISDYLKIPKQTMSRIIAMLIKENKVEQFKNQNDGRSFMIRLTTFGKEYFLTLYNKKNDFDKILIDKIGIDNFEELNLLMNKFLNCYTNYFNSQEHE